MLQNYNVGQTERLSTIKHWLGREGLQLIATLTQEEQEACNNEKSLFDTLNRKFKPQYNETIKSLQCCKLIRQSNESTEEWMGRLRKAAIECSYTEIDRHLKEQYIHGLNDEEKLAKIIRELREYQENNITIHSENVLTWATRVDAQRVQTVAISSLHRAKTVMQSYKISNIQTKDPQQIHSALEEDVNTADKNTH